MSANLMLHCGAREVSREDLAGIPVPAPSRRWVPIGHAQVAETVTTALAECGFTVTRERYGLSRGERRLFGTLDIALPIAEQVTLAVGVRNSIDQSFPLGFCAGARVFVCDNLSFSAELMVRRLHTLNGHVRFLDDIVQCVAKLEAFRQAESLRIERMKEAVLSDVEADSLMLRAYERSLISPRLLPKLIQTWREPTYGEFAARTRWSLFNACTEVLGGMHGTNPQRHAQATMRLQALMCPPMN